MFQSNLRGQNRTTAWRGDSDGINNPLIVVCLGLFFAQSGKSSFFPTILGIFFATHRFQANLSHANMILEGWLRVDPQTLEAFFCGVIHDVSSDQNPLYVTWTMKILVGFMAYYNPGI